MDSVHMTPIKSLRHYTVANLNACTVKLNKDDIFILMGVHTHTWTLVVDGFDQLAPLNPLLQYSSANLKYSSANLKYSTANLNVCMKNWNKFIYIYKHSTSQAFITTSQTVSRQERNTISLGRKIVPCQEC